MFVYLTILPPKHFSLQYKLLFSVVSCILQHKKTNQQNIIFPAHIFIFNISLHTDYEAGNFMLFIRKNSGNYYLDCNQRRNFYGFIASLKIYFN